MSENEFLLAISNLMDTKMDALEKIVDTKMDALEKRIDAKMDARFDAFEKRMDAKMDARFDAFEKRMDAKMDVRFDSIEKRVKRIEVDLIENNILPRLNTIEACYISTYERYKESADRMDAALDDVALLKKVVAEHSHRLAI